MEDTTGAARSSSSSLPPEVTMPPSSQRGQKRGAPDEDDAAGDGAARGSPRRACVDTLAEEEEEYYHMEFVDDGAPPARQLFEFYDAGGAAAGASASTAGQEPVDVTLRVGVGPLAGDYRGGTVNTTLSLGLGSAAAPGEDDWHRFQSDGEPATGAALGAAFNAATDIDEGRVRDAMAAALCHEPASEDEEGFFLACDFTLDCFTAMAGDGPVGSAADDDAADRPSSGLDLNQPCPSELPDGAPDPSDVPVPDPAVVDDDDLEAHVDERGVAATATATVEQRRRSSTPFDFFCSPVHDVRAPGVLTADSS